MAQAVKIKKMFTHLHCSETSFDYFLSPIKFPFKIEHLCTTTQSNPFFNENQLEVNYRFTENLPGIFLTSKKLPAEVFYCLTGTVFLIHPQ